MTGPPKKKRFAISVDHAAPFFDLLYGEGVTLVLGRYPLSDELRSLGIETARPLVSAWTEDLYGSSGACKKL